VAGLRLVMAGNGRVMVNAAADETPAAVVIVPLAEPEVAIKLAGTTAVNLVSQTNVVFRRSEPHFEVEVGVKLLPLMVSVNAAPAAMAKAGLRPIIAGGCEAIAAEALNERPSTLIDPPISHRTCSSQSQCGWRNCIGRHPKDACVDYTTTPTWLCFVSMRSAIFPSTKNPPTCSMRSSTAATKRNR